MAEASKQESSASKQLHEGVKQQHQRPLTPTQKTVDILILCAINMLNYSDRYNLVPVLQDLQRDFHLQNSSVGLILTVFVVTFTVSSPVFGYLGDRCDRKLLLISGMLLWNAATFVGSFADTFWEFLLCRAVFGVGQACFTIVAPTIISDFFVGSARSRILTVFYVAIPAGSGVGYVTGSLTAKVMGSWRWSLRLAPVPNVVLLMVMLGLLTRPRRHPGKSCFGGGSWIEDLNYLLKNKSFVWTTLAFVAVAFSSGAASWWAPKLILLGFEAQGHKVCPQSEALYFGFLMVTAGIIGLGLAFLLSHLLKPKCPQIDPVICGVGLLVSGPALLATSYAAVYSKPLCYCLFFVGMCPLNFNWAIASDVLLYVVVPPRRSFAMGLQSFVGHALGDAGSPYMLGLFCDVIYQQLKDNFKALQYAFFVSCFVEVLGGLFYFMNARYVLSDKKSVEGSEEML